MKERAFIRYTKQGRIVPGSLIVTTKGGYPSGPALWKEITVDQCCIPDPSTITTRVAANLSAASPLKLKFYCGTASDELLSSTGWTTTAGWTGSYGAGFTHSAGTTTLSNSLAAENSANYYVVVTITGTVGTGGATLTFGGVTTSTFGTATGTFTYAITATGTGNLIVTPTTTFTGTVKVSIVKMPAIVETLQSVQAGATTVANLVTALNNTYGILGTFSTTGSDNLTLVMADAQKQLICSENQTILMTVTP